MSRIYFIVFTRLLDPQLNEPINSVAFAWKSFSNYRNIKQA